MRIDLPALKHLIFKDYSLQGVKTVQLTGQSEGAV